MVRRIAIVGPGLMGLGIAQVAAAAGLEVVLFGRASRREPDREGNREWDRQRGRQLDQQQDQQGDRKRTADGSPALNGDNASASAGLERLATTVARQVTRGRLSPDAAAALVARVRPARSDADLAGCDLAIEAVAEDRSAKHAVLLRLQAGLPAGALIASNTSGLPITGLAAALDRPERFLGLHFFSPVPHMPLVEVVRGAATAAATLESALAFVRQIGQQPIVVRDGPGFYTSRVFAAYLDEALAMVGEGVAPAAIEAAGLALGRPIGPLAVLDEIGLRLNHQQALQAQADGLAPRFCRPLALPVLARMQALGRGGRREGGGFHDHSAEGRRLWPGLTEVFTPGTAEPRDWMQDPRAEHSERPQHLQDQDQDQDQDPSQSQSQSQPLLLLLHLQHRLRCAEALEALRCLEEGVLDSADDADTGSLLGLGFPAATGGVLRWVEAEGLDVFVQRCSALAPAHGARFAPSPWLQDLAAEGQGLARWRGPLPAVFSSSESSVEGSS